MSKQSKIKSVVARQILDSKFRPVLEVDVYTEGGIMGRGAAPTGSSVGKYESYILRDNDSDHFNGLSVYKAIDVVKNIIGPAIIGMDVTNQQAIDEIMIEIDGTPNKSKLGGNSIYSTSIAVLRAAAASQNLQLYQYLAKGELTTIPTPNFNVINGGFNKEAIQAFNEFMIVPYKVKNFEEAAEMAINVYQKLEKVIERFKKGRPAQLGGSYGWVAPSNDPETILKLMEEAVSECGYTNKIIYSIDCASSQMYDELSKTYELKGKRVTSEELINYVDELTKKFNILFVEDLLEEDDWDGYKKAKATLNRTNIFGDDLTVTNLERLKRAHELNAIDGFVFKPNQVGTISESLETFRFAKEKKIITLASGRSGGVINDVIADLSLGLQTELSKNGAPKSGERIEKMNWSIRASTDNPNSQLFDCSKIAKFKTELLK